jgi:Cu2+-exporting ATPase
MSTDRLTYSWKGAKEYGDILANAVIGLGYDLVPFGGSKKDHSNDQEKYLLRCLAVAGFAMGNLMMISIGLWSEESKLMGNATQDFLHWVSIVIALPAIMYAGRPFFYSAISVLKKRHTNMDVPISLAIILASAMSVSETINHGEHIYFDSAVMLLFFLLIGRYLDVRAKGKAKESAQELLSKMQGTATVLKDGKQRVVPIRDLKEGMTILVSAGENVPVDGKVSWGISELDISLITGETIPKCVREDDRVFAGTVNISAPIRIVASKSSDTSLLGDIVKLMEQSEKSQAYFVRIADRAAQLYTPIVHFMGLMTFLGWWLFGLAWQLALLNAITVLIITCPCALGLAVPVTQVLARGKLFKNGILLKSGDALERLAGIDFVVLDKTGTLTTGLPTLLDGQYNNRQLQIAASLAANSKHPLSKAISNTYSKELVDIEKVKEFPGMGIQAFLDGKEVKLGSRQWCGEDSITDIESLELWLNIDGEKVCFNFIDSLRSDAKEVVGNMQEAGLVTALLSGDTKQVVNKVAKSIGISTYFSSLSPVDKCKYIDSMREKGKKVLMVGDGLNDAPSLSSASVSMSPSSAIDIAQNTADIVFQGEKLAPVYQSWRVALKANKLIKQNFTIAVLYNIIAIPLAVMGYVTPLIAAIAMSSSSLVVIGNSFRLNRIRGL